MERLEGLGLTEGLAIRGIDLVDRFAPAAPGQPGLSLEVASLHRWAPPGATS